MSPEQREKYDAYLDGDILTKSEKEKREQDRERIRAAKAGSSR